MLKTIISSTGNRLYDRFDLRFGRAEWFCLYDEETGNSEFMENSASKEKNGAGTKAAEFVVRLGAEKVISGDFGPKARGLLDKLEIQMVILEDDELKIEDIIRKISSGK
jgi:predicted Fe-Mo cluster-binding NifX family protein